VETSLAIAEYVTFFFPKAEILENALLENFSPQFPSSFLAFSTREGKFFSSQRKTSPRSLKSEVLHKFDPGKFWSEQTKKPKEITQNFLGTAHNTKRIKVHTSRDVRGTCDI
jgi:hypothetical protein